ncbi:hypothetical protein RclHR1_31050001 [Rhizophagus clarus]|uniref:HMG box domain-containing protein n=1 Tax=Rhizophagus clarus TaxID=94130 RepID=A0A2Z6R6W7_9GLOM|nr:hypothetical protein RclHR1_31050001 [Rhizophagus clarus]GES78749.1 hypothetical protein GLOIN_2v1846864 [Rhizophagus clarus]
MNTLKVDWASKVLVEKTEELKNLIISFQNKIDNREMPKANEIVRVQDSGNKIKRPPNSNIIYTNQLGKCGLLDIIRGFCEEHDINKQKLVPISKKVSKSLWEELSPIHKKFFEDLATEVSDEHKKLHPNYKYKPVRKVRTEPMYKYYNHQKTHSRPNTSTDDEQHHELRSTTPTLSADSSPNENDSYLSSPSHHATNDDEQELSSYTSTLSAVSSPPALSSPVNHTTEDEEELSSPTSTLSAVSSPSTLNDSHYDDDEQDEPVDSEYQLDVKKTSNYSLDIYHRGQYEEIVSEEPPTFEVIDVFGLCGFLNFENYPNNMYDSNPF